jgi:hypothetical protein
MWQRSYALTACLLSLWACTPAPGDGSTPESGSGGRSNDASGGSTGSGGTSSSGGNGSGGSGSGSGGASGGATTGGASGSGGASGGTSGEGGSGGGDGSGGSSGVDAPMATGGAGGTSATDGGSTAPPATGKFDCTTAGAKFCSDFENFPAGQAPQGKWTTSGKVAIDTAQVYSGKQSLKISGPKGSFNANMKFGADFLPVGGTEFHGRFMVYFSDIPNKTNGGAGCHFDLAIASGAGGTYILGGMYGNFMGVYHPGDCSKDSDQPIPTKKWACVQWEFSGEPGKTHAFRMLLNGKVVPNGEVTDAGPANCQQTAAKRWQPPAQFTSLTFGWVNYQNNPVPIEMWVDDFAFGPKPIPCPDGL